MSLNPSTPTPTAPVPGAVELLRAQTIQTIQIKTTLNQDEINALLAQIDQFVKVKELKAMTERDPRILFNLIVQTLTTIMSLVGEITKLTGQQKKMVVMDLLQLFVSRILLDIEGDTPLVEFVDKLLETIIPILIDTLISVENDHLIFNKKPFLEIGKFFQSICCSSGTCAKCRCDKKSNEPPTTQVPTGTETKST